jgi:ThiF family protein
MTRMINTIDSSIQVTPYPDFFPTEATVKALRHCDLIVACADHLQVRDDLNRFAKRYLIPMIDVGIEITPGRSHPGAVAAITGRVTKVLPAGPCLAHPGLTAQHQCAALADPHIRDQPVKHGALTEPARQPGSRPPNAEMRAHGLMLYTGDPATSTWQTPRSFETSSDGTSSSS